MDTTDFLREGVKGVMTQERIETEKKMGKSTVI